MRKKHEVFHINPILVSILLVLSIGMSAFALYKVHSFEKTFGGQSIKIEEFLEQMTSHSSTASFAGASPLNIVQVTQQNLALLQSQINGLDVSFLGDYLVQYPNFIVIYNYDEDIVKDIVQLQQAPALPPDFMDKLGAHQEVADVSTELPQGGQLDEQSVAALKQEFPEEYENIKPGDFLLRYSNKIVVYDYLADDVVGVVDLTSP